MTDLIKVAGLLILASIISACSESGRPADAIETELSVTMMLGQFDVEFGQMGYSTIYVEVDGQQYPLESGPEAEFRGFEGLSRLELGGRRALIAGDIVDGVYMATYAELLPAAKPAVDEAEAEVEALQAELTQVAALLAELYERQALLMQQGSDTQPLEALQAQIQETEERYLHLYELLDPEFVNRARLMSE